MRTLILTLLFQFIISVTLLAQEDWVVLESPTGNDLYSVDFINNNKGIAVGEQGTILKTTDGGITWQSIITCITNDLRGVCFYDENHAVAVGTGGQIIVSENGGNTWASHWLPGIQWDLYAVDITPDGIGIASGQQSTILYTSNGGLNWSVVQEQIPGFCNAVRRYNDSITFVFGTSVGPSQIHKLVNNTIDNVYQFYTYYNSTICEGTLFDGYVFDETSVITVGRVEYNFPQILGSININQELENNIWDNYLTMDSVEFKGVDFIGDYGIVAGSRNTKPEKSIILETMDGGKIWNNTYQIENTPNLRDVKMIGNMAYVVGNEGLIMKKLIQTTGIKANDPNTTNLTVYPNPSRGDCQINFTLEAPESVCINVFDMNGRLINTPFTGNLGTGTHNIINPLTTEPGKSPIPGLYLIRLMAGSQTSTVKILIR